MANICTVDVVNFYKPTSASVESLLMHLWMVRLLNAFAEEQATEDAVYYMGEALRKGVVDLDVFLKVAACHVAVLIVVCELLKCWLVHFVTRFMLRCDTFLLLVFVIDASCNHSCCAYVPKVTVSRWKESMLTVHTVCQWQWWKLYERKMADKFSCAWDYMKIQRGADGLVLWVTLEKLQFWTVYCIVVWTLCSLSLLSLYICIPLLWKLPLASSSQATYSQWWAVVNYFVVN